MTSLTAAEFQAIQGKKKPATATKRSQPTKDTEAPVASLTSNLSAQQTAAAGLAGVQVWNGVDGQGSVLRFFELSPDDKQALLALAAERGIYPVRR